MPDSRRCMTRFGDLPEVYFASDTKGIGEEGYRPAYGR
jgi:hypothetical protein